VVLIWISVSLILPFARLLPLQSQVYLNALFSRVTLFSVFFTLQLSLGALVISAALAVMVCVVFRKLQKAGWDFLCSLLLRFLELLWILPSFLYAMAVIGFLKWVGAEQLYSVRALFMGFVLAGVPFISVQIIHALRDLDEREEEAMRSLGANLFRLLTFHYFPKLKRFLGFALLQQLWLYLTSFSLVMLLNGGPPFETLEVSVYTSTKFAHLNLEAALAFATWQLILLIGLRFIWKKTGGFQSFESNVQEWFQEKEKPKKIFFKEWSFSRCSLPALFLVAFYALYRVSETTDGELLDSLILAITQGFQLSASVSLITVGTAALLYFFNLRFLADLGGWMSPMLLSLLWWRAYAFEAPSLLLCVGIQVFLFLPWISRGLYPLLDRKRSFELEAAQSLGASARAAWWIVEWSRIKKTVYWYLSLLFALSLAEVSTVILFSDSQFEPLSVWIQNEMSRFRLGEASLGILALLLLSSAALFIPLLFQKRKNAS
jgi:thiamine transport system permease protein